MTRQAGGMTTAGKLASESLLARVKQCLSQSDPSLRVAFLLLPSTAARPMSDLRGFIIRTEVLHLYRSFLRVTKTAPEHARGTS